MLSRSEIARSKLTAEANLRFASRAQIVAHYSLRERAATGGGHCMSIASKDYARVHISIENVIDESSI